MNSQRTVNDTTTQILVMLEKQVTCVKAVHETYSVCFSFLSFSSLCTFPVKHRVYFLSTPSVLDSKRLPTGDQAELSWISNISSFWLTHHDPQSHLLPMRLHLICNSRSMPEGTICNQINCLLKTQTFKELSHISHHF